jgi:topoisomerase-4 subunit B
VKDDKDVKGLLDYYMGKNTQERQDFIISNLKIEKDVPEQELQLELA